MLLEAEGEGQVDVGGQRLTTPGPERGLKVKIPG